MKFSEKRRIALIVCFGSVALIFVIALSTTGLPADLSQLTRKGEFILLIQIFLSKFWFQPLWAVVLFTWNLSSRFEHEARKETLDRLKGYLKDKTGRRIPSQDIYDIVFKSDDFESSIEAAFDQQDTISPVVGAPRV